MKESMQQFETQGQVLNIKSLQYIPLSSCSCTLRKHVDPIASAIASPGCSFGIPRASFSELVCRRSVRRKDRHCPDVCGSGIRSSGMSGCRACRSALVCDEVARERPAKCCFGMSTVRTLLRNWSLLSSTQHLLYQSVLTDYSATSCIERDKRN